MKLSHKNNANQSCKKNARTIQKPKTKFPQCLPGTHSHKVGARTMYKIALAGLLREAIYSRIKDRVEGRHTCIQIALFPARFGPKHAHFRAISEF